MFRSPRQRSRTTLTIGLSTLTLAFMGLAIGGTADALVLNAEGAGQHENHMRIKLDGAYSQSTHDGTPSISGRVDVKGDLNDIQVSASLSGTAKDGTHYSAVPCTGITITDRGKWNCTFTTTIKVGHYTVTVNASATDPSGATLHDSASKQIVIVRSEPKADPKPTPTPKPTETPAPDPVVKPKPVTQVKPAPQKTTTVAPKTITAPVVPKELTWQFRVINAQGDDVTGQGLHLGDHVRIVATGLPAGAQVELVLHSTPTTLGSAVAAADGSLNLPVKVPPTIEVGQHRLIATLTAPGFAPSVAAVGLTLARDLELNRELDGGPLRDAPTIEPVTPSSDGDTRGFDDEHSGLADSLQTIHDIQVTPWKFAATGGLAAALVLLAALPAELLASTLNENYGRAFAWLEPARRRVRRVRVARTGVLSNPWVSSFGTVALAALILSFADPGVGISMASFKTFLALFLSLVMLNIAVGAIKLSAAKSRLNTRGHLLPMPGALLVAAVSVLVSRMMDLHPGLLFGLVVGVTFAYTQSKRTEGKLALLAVSSVLALGLGAWLWFSIIIDVAGDAESFGIGLLEETLAATALECLSVLVVAMLPFQFLEGKPLRDWNRWIWAGMYGVCAFVFIFIAVPLGENWHESTAPLGTWLTIITGFGIIATAAWAIFRFVPSHEHDHADVKEHAEV